MKILDSQWQLSSQRSAYQFESKLERLQISQRDANGNTIQLDSSRQSQRISAEFESYGVAVGRRHTALPPVATPSGHLPAAPTAARSSTAPSNSAAAKATEPEADMDSELWLAQGNLMLLKRLLEALTGREIRLPEMDFSVDLEPLPPPDPGTGAASSAFSARYDFVAEYREVELTAFSISGELVTADGRHAAIDFDMLMARDYQETTIVSLRRGDAATKDPLVLNFGIGPQLTTSSQDFDVDGDGHDEAVHFATGDTAFLALDRDHSGAIESGKELFGTISGNGFADLAVFDDDGNGFIDEGDEVFDLLRLLSRSEDGNERLDTLAGRGVGAIYLGHAPTSFDLTDDRNQLQAQVRATGIFLSEDLTPGSVQQLDLVV